MADSMLIPTPAHDVISVSTKVAQKYYALYVHHLEHNKKLTESETEYLKLYIKYYEKVRDAEYV
jgi:hypothetical protein